MVNVTDSRYSLIKTLKNSSFPVSGEDLAKKLNISRVGVWKIVQKLKDDGYAIESSRNGYRLKQNTDLPLPWEMENGLGDIIFLKQTDSTMNEAEKYSLHHNNGSSATVIAATQNRGKGIENSEWKSPEGGLYFTRIFRHQLHSSRIAAFTEASALSICEAVGRICGTECCMKWPNSIMIGDKKVGGILTSFRGELFHTSELHTGTGLYISTPDSELPEGISSIKSVTGKTISTKELMSEILLSLEQTEKTFIYTTDKQEN